MDAVRPTAPCSTSTPASAVLGRAGGVGQAGSRGGRGRPDERGRSRVERRNVAAAEAVPTVILDSVEALPRGQALAVTSRSHGHRRSAADGHLGRGDGVARDACGTAARLRLVRSGDDGARRAAAARRGIPPRVAARVRPLSEHAARRGAGSVREGERFGTTFRAEARNVETNSRFDAASATVGTRQSASVLTMRALRRSPRGARRTCRTAARTRPCARSSPGATARRGRTRPSGFSIASTTPSGAVADGTRPEPTRPTD